MKIIAQTPITKPSPATTRGCVVIREDETQYVVHTAEADEDGNLVAFYWGYYILKDRPRALQDAVAVLCRKAALFYGISLYEEEREVP
jgi:hypothetical protein